MRDHILLPCSCGKIHKFKDPGQNMTFTCNASGTNLSYVCMAGDQFHLKSPTKTHLLEENEITMGRDPGNVLVIPSPELSRRHCVLRRTEDGYELVDLHSANGTFVNEVRLEPNKPQPLVGGDLLRLAEIYLRYVEPLNTDNLTTHRRAEDLDDHSTINIAPPSKGEARGADDPMIGRSFGDFRITGFLAQGGMGRVYMAEQISLNRPCVVKTILPERNMSDNSIRRFLQEVQVGASVSHPNIVVFFGAGQENDVCFVAMEHFAGTDLNKRFRGHPAEFAEAIKLLRQVASALAATHDRGIVHRDIKPQNILVDDHGHVKVIDFGLAKVWQDPQYVHLTASSGILGSPAYMSPEQIANPRQVDHRVDIYALGVVLFFCVTGRPPFVEDSPVEVLYKVGFGIPKPAQFRPDLPPRLEAVILKAAHLQPAQRYQTAQEFIDALDGLGMG